MVWLRARSKRCSDHHQPRRKEVRNSQLIRGKGGGIGGSLRYMPGKAETSYASILKINNSLRFPSEALKVICKHLQASFHGAELQAKLPLTSQGAPRGQAAR